jgi:hypothetical protein
VVRGIAVSFLDPGARRGWGSPPRPDRFTPGKHQVPIIQEVGWAPGPVWTCMKNLAPHRDSIPGPSSPYPVAIPIELPGPHEASGHSRILQVRFNVWSQGRRRGRLNTARSLQTEFVALVIREYNIDAYTTLPSQGVIHILRK